MNKKILITGGAGFIGSNLSLKLIEKGYKVTVLDNLSKQVHGNDPEKSILYQSIKNKVTFIKGSVTDYETVLNTIKNQDIIVHLAAETGTGQSMYEIKKYVDVNIGGTALLLDILVNTKHTIKKVVVASSRSIYGEGKYISRKHGVVYPEHRTSAFMDKGDFEVKYQNKTDLLELVATDEDSKIHPSSVYGITKYNQEQMVMTVCSTIGISPVAFRYQNVYGPGQSLSNPYTGILSIFSTLILNGNPINIFEDGKESRDFVFIDDVVDATILGIEMESANENIYNVGTGKAITVLQVVEELMKCYNKKVSYQISGNYRIGDIRHNYADISKIKSDLGFITKINFEEGIKKFAAWVQQQNIHTDNYQESLNEMKNKGLFK